MNWTALDTWIVVTGALIGMACALPGLFLLLNRQSMFGDAITHAVLPGIALAFLISGTRDIGAMLLGAVIAGLATAMISHLIAKSGQVEEGAALGVTFCTLFALGLILIRVAADKVDLDPDCVLYGSLETSVLDLGFVPSVTWRAAGILLFNLVLGAVFYKELRICSFDPALATSLGFPAGKVRLALMVVTSITTVIAFESVGSILVIAMLIVPPAAALLLTRRLGEALLLSLLIAALSALLGHVGAISTLPALAQWVFGQNPGAASTAGMIAVASGLLCATALAWNRCRHRLSPTSKDPLPNPAAPAS